MAKVAKAVPWKEVTSPVKQFWGQMNHAERVLIYGSFLRLQWVRLYRRPPNAPALALILNRASEATSVRATCPEFYAHLENVWNRRKGDITKEYLFVSFETQQQRMIAEKRK